MPEKPVKYESSLSGLPQLGPNTARRREQAARALAQDDGESPFLPTANPLPLGGDVSRDVVQRLIGLLKDR
jgi:hypothetical protein